MNIVFCIDNNYTLQCRTLIYSILAVNRNIDISFHIISSELTENNKRIIKNAVSEINPRNVINFFYYNLSSKDISDFKVSQDSYLSVSTFFRFYIQSLLPSNIEKVLYIDVDTICVQELLSFYNLDIASYSVACITDMNAHDIRIQNRLNYNNINQSYFNAGVLLINLNYWRKNNIQSKLISFFIENQEKCLMNDQDALNAVLKDSTFYVSSKYNTMTSIFEMKHNSFILKGVDIFEKEKTKLNPTIIHYAGKIKPWNKEYKIYAYPYFQIFDYLNKKSKSNIKYTYYEKNRNIKWYIKKIFSLIGFYHSPYEIKYEDTSLSDKKLIDYFEINYD